MTLEDIVIQDEGFISENEELPKAKDGRRREIEKLDLGQLNLDMTQILKKPSDGEGRR